MPFYRFKLYRRYLPSINIDTSKQGSDPWYKLISGIEEFNQIRREKISGIHWIQIDESMSSWRTRTSAIGGLPNISFILRKPKPLGTEFKSTGCCITGVMRCLEIQRGKKGMSAQKYNETFGATVGCSLLLTEQTISPENAASTHGLRGDAWFGSVKAASQMAVRGHQCCFQVKGYSALYPKEYIEDALKDAPGGVFIALQGNAPNEQTLVAMGYRYSRKSTLFF